MRFLFQFTICRCIGLRNAQFSSRGYLIVLAAIYGLRNNSLLAIFPLKFHSRSLVRNLSNRDYSRRYARISVQDVKAIYIAHNVLKFGTTGRALIDFSELFTRARKLHAVQEQTYK